MKPPSIDELVLLPEPLALQRHFDARNYRFFRWILVVIVAMKIAEREGFSLWGAIEEQVDVLRARRAGCGG